MYMYSMCVCDEWTLCIKYLCVTLFFLFFYFFLSVLYCYSGPLPLPLPLLSSVRVQMLPGIRLKSFSVGLSTSDDSYMPKTIAVSVGNTPTNLKEIKQYSIPRYVIYMQSTYCVCVCVLLFLHVYVHFVSIFMLSLSLSLSLSSHFIHVHVLLFISSLWF